MTESQFDAYHKWLGIRPSERPPTAYRLLGLAKYESDQEVIESAADQRMAHVRTFQLGKHAALSQRLLNELAEAKVRLLNAEAKASYDAELRAAETPVAAVTMPTVPLPTAAAPSAVAPAAPIPVARQTVAAAGSFELPPKIVRREYARRSKSRAPVLLGALCVAAAMTGLAGRGWFFSSTPPAAVSNSNGTRVARLEPAQTAPAAAALPPPREIRPALTELGAQAKKIDEPPRDALPSASQNPDTSSADNSNLASGAGQPSPPSVSEPDSQPGRSLKDLLGPPEKPADTGEATKSLASFASSAPKASKEKDAAARPKLAPKDAILIDGRWYWFSPAQATAQQAQLVAAKYKGRMLIISSPEENISITPYLKGPTFLGLLKIKGVWVNAEGRPQDYFNWDRGQPSASGGERFAAIHPSGRWHDYRADTLYFCIEWGKEAR